MRVRNLNVFPVRNVRAGSLPTLWDRDWQINWQSTQDNLLVVDGYDLKACLADLGYRPRSEDELKRAIANCLDDLVEMMLQRGYVADSMVLSRRAVAPTPFETRTVLATANRRQGYLATRRR